MLDIFVIKFSLICCWISIRTSYRQSYAVIVNCNLQYSFLVHFAEPIEMFLHTVS